MPKVRTERTRPISRLIARRSGSRRSLSLMPRKRIPGVCPASDQKPIR